MASLNFARPSILPQLFPGSPHFTEKDLPDLTGNVYLVTGANSGVGKELTRLLYGANATVYMGCRSEAKCQQAIQDIKTAVGNDSKGRLEYLHVDLGDLRTIKPTAEAFLAKEQRLHVLFNNAGVMLPPPDHTATAQGYDLQLGTNCVAPFLLTQLLTPVLQATAADPATPKGTVRVVWVSSMATEIYSQKYGLDMDNIKGKGYVHEPKDPMARYGNSKAGNYLHSVAYARNHPDIISVALNPGNLDSELYRSTDNQTWGIINKIGVKAFRRFLLYPVVNGAYTELFAGISPQVTPEKSGGWIVPWGRFCGLRKDVADNAKPKAAGGRGGAEAFWDWTMEQVKPFM